MKLPRVAVVGLVSTGLVFSSETVASAAPPSNDTIAGATVITGLPFTDTVDTTEATTDATELAAAQPCLDLGAPAIEKAVWYTGAIASDASAVAIDVTASTYTAGIAVYAAPPSADTFLTCGPGIVSGPVTPGQTFYIMVFGDTPGSPGGTLQLSVFEVVEPAAAITVDPIARFDGRTGTATVTGTAACSGADFAEIFGSLRQPVGRFAIEGFFSTFVACDGTTGTWSAEVTGNGKYAGGKATVAASILACTTFGCGGADIVQDVRLRR